MFVTPTPGHNIFSGKIYAKKVLGRVFAPNLALKSGFTPQKAKFRDELVIDLPFSDMYSMTSCDVS